MKKTIFTIMTLVLLAVTVGAKINLPEANQFQLANGMKVQIIERHTLPLFSLQMNFKAGSSSS